MKFKDIEYKRPDFEEYFKTINDKLDSLEKTDSEEEFFNILNEIEEEGKKFSQAYNISYIRNSINTRDEFYEKEVEAFDEVLPRAHELSNKLQRIRLNSKFREEFERRFGTNITNTDQLQLDIFKPEIMEDRVEEAKLSNEYQKLLGTAEIEYDGKKLNISQMSPYLQSRDREVRKNASEAFYNWFSKNSDELDRIYDELVSIRHRIAKKLGFESYIEVAYRSFGRTDWDRNDAKNYRDLIKKHIVPLTQKFYQEQSERIGIKDMKYYDISLKFLSGNPTPKGERDYLVNEAQKMYKELSEETEEFFNTMIEWDLMDLDSKDGKAPGGYMTQLEEIGLPFIFANFNGTAHDVDVLTHEAGHAFQGYLTRDVYPRANAAGCMEIMETHSMSMEFFTHPWMEAFFKEDTEKYYYNHVVSALEFLPYGALIDHYQEWVYDNPEATEEERNTEFRRLQMEYMPHLDYENNEYLNAGKRWHAQMHVFQVPFYYLDYTIAQLNAFQFFVLDLENHEDAWSKYLELCKLGGKLGTKEIIKNAGLKVPFEEETFEFIVPKLEAYLDSLDKSKIL